MAAFSFSCQKPNNEDEPVMEFSLSETSLNYDATGGSLTVTLKSTEDWKVDNPADWLTVTPSSGSGSSHGQIVTVKCEVNTGEDRSADLNFFVESGNKVKLEVVQAGGGSGDAIKPEAGKWYVYRKADKVESGKSYLLVAVGKAAVPYAADINYGYMNTAGVVENKGEIVTLGRNAFIFTAVEGGYAINQAIDGRFIYLEGTYNSFQVGAKLPETGHVWEISRNGEGKFVIRNAEKDKTVQYDPEYGTIAAYASETGIYPYLFECVEVTEAPVTPSISGIPSWMELPETKEDDGLDFYYHDHVVGGKMMRSWSFDYDPEALLSHWVAYPLNKDLIGNGKRSDQWGLDPKVPVEQQPVLYKTYKSNHGSYQRGHQIPSADRLDYEANIQTFYFTNMTPQMGGLNEAAWADLETRVRQWSASFDTLYVVTGCSIEGSDKIAYDNDGKEVKVPVGYFKALLGYQEAGKVGITSETGGYTGCAFWFDHEAYSGDFMKKSMTIAELEEKTGINFFVNLPAKTGEETASKVETTVDKWWK